MNISSGYAWLLPPDAIESAPGLKRVKRVYSPVSSSILWFILPQYPPGPRLAANANYSPDEGDSSKYWLISALEDITPERPGNTSL